MNFGFYLTFLGHYESTCEEYWVYFQEEYGGHIRVLYPTEEAWTECQLWPPPWCRPHVKETEVGAVSRGTTEELGAVAESKKGRWWRQFGRETTEEPGEKEEEGCELDFALWESKHEITEK